MDTGKLTRDRQDREDGIVHLRLAGPEGGISLLATCDGGHITGCLGIHSSEPMFDGQQPTECGDFGETCYADLTYTHGHKIAVLLYTGHEEAAWAALEVWYAERFAPWRNQ